jgi:hypothetical protein
VSIKKRQLLAILAMVAIAGGLALPNAVFAGVGEPLPVTVPPAPPPIPDLPAAGPTVPPAGLIGDPITPEATCGSWMLQSRYGGMWSTGQTWWEFQCVYEWKPCYTICNADWSGSQLTRDHFIYDGSAAVLIGEVTLDTYADSTYVGDFCTYWWDVPTRSWYRSETASCHDAPVPEIEAACSDLVCTFEAHVTIDEDWPIGVHRWSFGDGEIAYGSSAVHTYRLPETYSVTLDVQDAGLWGSTTSSIAVTGPTPTPTPAPTPTPTPTPTPSPTPAQIHLTADAVKTRGVVTVSLAWSGAVGPVDVFRDGTRLATTTAVSYVDVMNRPPKGSRTYRVCLTNTNVCSGPATITV